MSVARLDAGPAAVGCVVAPGSAGVPAAALSAVVGGAVFLVAGVSGP